MVRLISLVSKVPRCRWSKFDDRELLLLLLLREEDEERKVNVVIIG